MNIHYFFGEEWEEQFVRAKLPNENIVFHDGSLAKFPELSDPDAQVLCTFIESNIGENELSRFPSLKLIATRSTGFDHIDMKTAKASGCSAVLVLSGKEREALPENWEVSPDFVFIDLFEASEFILKKKT